MMQQQLQHQSKLHPANSGFEGAEIMLGCFPVTQLSPSVKTSCQSIKMGCGITNMGNTCYMSSVLQCLAALPPIKYALQQDMHLHGFSSLCPLRAKNWPCTCCLMQSQLVSRVRMRNFCCLYVYCMYARVKYVQKRWYVFAC